MRRPPEAEACHWRSTISKPPRYFSYCHISELEEAFAEAKATNDIERLRHVRDELACRKSRRARLLFQKASGTLTVMTVYA